MAACRSNSDPESRARRWHVDGPSRAQAEETAAFHQKQFHGHLGFWFLTPSYVFFFRLVVALRCPVALLHRLASCAVCCFSRFDQRHLRGWVHGVEGQYIDVPSSPVARRVVWDIDLCRRLDERT